MRFLLTASLLSLLSVTASSQDTSPTEPAPAAAAAAAAAADATAAASAEAAPSDPLHAPFDALLAAHVRAGFVDYTGLARDSAALDAYLAALAGVDASALERAQTLALWINAYNAATLRLILDHRGDDGGLASIKDIPRAQRWLAQRWVVAGRTVSLDDIEHAILRPLGEPRIHFAINCASRSCPELRAEAYHAARLDSQLDEATRRFLADRTKGLSTEVDEGLFGTSYELHLSPIFDWFEADFTRDGGSVVGFVRRFAPEAAVRFIDGHRDALDVEFVDYDWSLNGR